MANNVILYILLLPFSSSFTTIIPWSVLPWTSRCSCAFSATIDTKSSGRFPMTSLSPTTSLYYYGKGSKIWPECNEEPIRLSASFPGGVVPQAAMDLLSSSVSSTSSFSITGASASPSAIVEHTPNLYTGRKRRAVRHTISHLLRSAAQASNRRASTNVDSSHVQTYGVSPPGIDKGPAILALALVGLKCVQAKYMATVLGITFYLIGLASWCAAPKGSNGGGLGDQASVNMPSLPTRGHVPNLISNPLGSSLTNSWVYRTWLRLGALLGLLLPILALGWLSLGVGCRLSPVGNLGNVELAKMLVGGPAFLLCCQALTEAVARTALVSDISPLRKSCIIS